MTYWAGYKRPFHWHQWLLWLICLPGFSQAQSISPAPESFLHNLSGMNLVDQTGQAFLPDSLARHTVLFNFIYTNCSYTCSLQTYLLGQVMQALPSDVRGQVRFVSVSIDPANDTPAKLKAFAQQMQADVPGWFFLTGDTQQIEQLARRLRVVDDEQAMEPSLHRTSLWLVDRDGRMLQRYQGDPPDKERLLKELSQVSSLAVLP